MKRFTIHPAGRSSPVSANYGGIWARGNCSASRYEEPHLLGWHVLLAGGGASPFDLGGQATCLGQRGTKRVGVTCSLTLGQMTYTPSLSTTWEKQHEVEVPLKMIRRPIVSEGT
jgi:hypothetical protein